MEPLLPTLPAMNFDERYVQVAAECPRVHIIVEACRQREGKAYEGDLVCLMHLLRLEL